MGEQAADLRGFAEPVGLQRSLCLVQMRKLRSREMKWLAYNHTFYSPGSGDRALSLHPALF